MKETNLLEMQLRSLRPRRPSAGLKRRIFRTPVAGLPGATWLLGWLAPATACVLLACSVLNSGTGVSNGASQHGPLLAMSLSNLSYAPYAPANYRSGQNDLTSVTFDWTNRSGSTSSMSFPRF
jgi:hypothetical protein